LTLPVNTPFTSSVLLASCTTEKLIVSGDLLKTVMLLLSTLVGYCSE